LNHIDDLLFDVNAKINPFMDPNNKYTELDREIIRYFDAIDCDK